MDQIELTKLFCSRPRNFAWLLGAGASRSSGLPTATDLIWDLKLRQYCRAENQDISRQDIQSEAVRARIQSYFDSRGFPKLCSENEYTTYFEKIFGDDYERQRAYLRAILSEDKASLSVGLRVLAGLLAQGHCRAVFTTNFDTLLEKALAEVAGKALAPFHLEGSYAAASALNNEEFPLYVKLHGDFRYQSLKNLSKDLAHQNTELAKSFIAAGSRFGLVVAGYSGRDESVMQLFQQVLDGPNPFPHGLFWTGIKGGSIHPAVEALIKNAQTRGVNAEYIGVETFDALMLRLWRQIEDKTSDVDNKIRKTLASKVSIPLPPAGTDMPLLRMNALPLVSLPNQCLELTFDSKAAFTDLQRTNSAASPSIIIAKGDGVLAWGSIERAKQIFGNELKEANTRNLPGDFFIKNVHLKGFLEEALGRALARERPIAAVTRYSKTQLVVHSSPEDPNTLKPLSDVIGAMSGKVPGLFIQVPSEERAIPVQWAESLRINIDYKGGQFWALINPDIWIRPAKAREKATDFLSNRKKGRLNNKHNEIMSAWIKILFGPDGHNSEVEIMPFDSEKSSENPTFSIGSRTAFSRRLSS